MSEVGILRLQHPDGQVFSFEPGSISLAFAVTGAPGHARFETLHVPADLARWAGSVLGVHDLPTSPATLARAKRLRRAIWGAVEAVIEHRAPSAADRRTLNAAAAPMPMTPRLTAGGTSSWRRPLRASAVLSTVARDAIDVLAGPRAARLKRCQGVSCSIPFVDTSRPGTRRWCSMERCGNRAKARTHYQQHRQEA